ncbi:MAG: MobF family relaxase [Nocardioides sp.]
MKIYRGSASAARTYVEADRSRVDDYYLAEGTGLAERFVAVSAAGDAAGRGVGGVRTAGSLDGDAYEAWVAGLDVETGAAKGRLRTDDQAVRFVEVVVNGPKTWSLAAALHPELSVAYDAAQDRAAGEIVGWLAEHATTRVGPRGRQVQVPVEEIEAAVVRHHTSRAGDPHRHLHLQVNARVWATGGWRGIHTVGVRDSLDAINGIGHAAVMCDPGFRTALAELGYTVDVESGEIEQLQDFAGAFSARAAQIGRNVDRYEAQWRAQHPGEEPGRRLRQGWDTRAWAEARPDKVVPRDGAELRQRWVQELGDLGFCPPKVDPTSQGSAAPSVMGPRIGQLNRDVFVEVALLRIGARRSGWNAADVRGEIERLVAAVGLVAASSARTELTEDLTHRALQACVPLLARTEVPEHIRSLTSPRVLAVEHEITARLEARSGSGEAPARSEQIAAGGLDVAQQHVAQQLAGQAGLLVVEGAAGAGKTSTLAAAQAHLTASDARMVVVSPTLKAAAVAGRELGTPAFSAAWLAHQHGFRWDQDGTWSRVTAVPDPQARLLPGDLLVVDEAGMLDQDTALALLTIVDEAGSRVALVGDRHQLPAVGRGGVLDLATDVAAEGACLTLETVHRFADPEYSALSLRMRTGEQAGEVFDKLLARGEIEIHASEVERQQRLSNLPVGDLVTADTREQVAALNAATRDRHVAHGRVDDRHVVTTGAGERIGLGDTVTTRRNDRTVGVANRDTWTVTALRDGGSLVVVRDPQAQGGTHGGTRAGTRAGTLRGTPDQGRPERVLPAGYVREHVELGYARTVYGAQGETVGAAHLAVGDNTGAASAYVAMTRGRDANTAHLVAESVQDARGQWMAVFGRDRADLGPRQAAHRAGEDLDRYGGLEWDESLEVTEAASRRLRLSRDRDSAPGYGSIPARGPSR